PPLVFYSEKASLAYHLNLKAASSSIESVLLYLEQGIPMAGEEKFELAVASLTKPQQPQENYTHFSFSINPFKRLVSCYENKVVQEAHLTDKSLDIYMLGWLKRSKSFDQFVKRVTKIPPRLLEGHLAYQHPIFYKDGEKRLDFIGKVETIREDYEKLSEVY
ncbi:TPA: sulfotransferase family 2 domain-containing protein, partial [Bacillus anthracis]|nr:sulfotransferase family 2 domain-containing protein [Bacillus anthracis]